MTNPIPDGIELSRRNNAVTELNIQALSGHVALVETLQIVTASNHTPSCFAVKQATFDLDRDFISLVLHNKTLILPLLLVRLENRLDEHIAGFAVKHNRESGYGREQRR